MNLIDFLQQNAKEKMLKREFAQFSRWEYEEHLKNMCSLITKEELANMRMIQVPFCVNLWHIDEVQAFSSYSLSPSSCEAIFFYRKDMSCPVPRTQGSVHRHNYYEFVYVYKGYYTHTINQQSFTYSENEFLLLEPGIYHQEKMENDSIIIFFCISNSLFEKLMANPRLTSLLSYKMTFDTANVHCSAYTPNSDDTSNNTRALAETLIQEIVLDQPGSDLISEGFFYRLIGILLTPELYTCQNHILSGQAQERLNLSEELQAYLWYRNGQATRTEIAERFNYCADYLNRLLKKHTDCTISRYNQRIALQKAKQLLRETDLSIAEIISELGFENRSFFYRLFEKNCGITPSEYRKLDAEKQTEVEM